MTHVNVFVIGATGYIGRRVTTKLLAAEHRVIALARSAESAANLPAGNVETFRGEVADLDSLRQGLELADAVIYLAIKGLRGPSPEDSTALNLILDTLAGTDRPFIVTSGLAVYTGLPGAEFDEDTSLEAAAPAVAWRVQLERTVREAARRPQYRHSPVAGLWARRRRRTCRPPKPARNAKTPHRRPQVAESTNFQKTGQRNA